MNSMNPAVISKRKSGLEKWLQHALTFKILETRLKSFLEIPSDVLSKPDAPDKINDDEILIKEFETSIQSSPHSKTNIIDSFDKKFFHKRRTIREQYINTLLKTIVPLCSDEYIGSKSLYVLYKLCNSVYFREFELAIKELAKLPAQTLALMKLNDHLMKRRSSDGQSQAYHILNEIRGYMDEASLEIVLEYDEEALSVFRNWNSGTVASKVVNEVVSTSDWRTLTNNEDICINFRIENKELEFWVWFNIESDMYSIAELIVTPSKRKLWDLSLQEMEEVKRNHDDKCFRLLYSHDRNLYEFHSSLSINTSIFCSKIQFKSKNFTHLQTKGILGRLESHYKLEKNLNNDHSFTASPSKEQSPRRTSSGGDLLLDELEKKKSSIKVTWKAKFCEISKKMLISDCFQETEIVRNTFARFLEVAESRTDQVTQRNPSNSIWQACERKKLRLTYMRKISSPEEFRDLDVID